MNIYKDLKMNIYKIFIIKYKSLISEHLPNNPIDAVLTAGLVSPSPFLIASRPALDWSPPNPNIFIPSPAQFRASA